MYEEYMQNFFNYPVGGYRNTYEHYNPENIGMNYEKMYDLVDSYPYGYNPNYIQGNMQSYQNRNVTQELEDCYPEIYKIVYPMVRKVCAKSNNYRGYSKLDIDRMVEEVYSNIEVNDAVELNITLNNDMLYNFYNTLAAFSVLGEYGLDKSKVCDSISSLNREKRRK